MKFLLIILSVFSFSVSADVVGTWLFSGSGCRDNDLSADSHVSGKFGDS